MREILTVATGPVVMLAEELDRIDAIESAVVYGSFAERLRGDAGPAPSGFLDNVRSGPAVAVIGELPWR